MNMQSTIETSAPAIGTACDRPGGGLAYIVAIRPDDGPATFTICAPGAAPMSRNRWTYTLASEAHVSEVSEHIAAPMIERARNVPPISEAEAAALWERAKAAQAASRAAAQAEQERAAASAEQAKSDLQRYAPAWAQAAIVAELKQDDCDSMTDYFGSKTIRRVVIGWSKHKRDLFPELRKAAATFPETADLVDAPASAEHREKYSMGGGFYLKNGWRHRDGWQVSKSRIDWLGGSDLEFTDNAKGTAAPPIRGTELRAPIDGTGSNAAGLFTVSQHVHTKKGFDMWICTLAERVERADFDRFLAAAKALGGWYSKPWGGTPGGFAFKVEAKALEFIGADTGGDNPAPTDGNGPGAAKVERAPIPRANPAAKLREMADAMQAAIDDKFRDRLSNTPKRARQAAEARNDGLQLERAQKIMRALADAHDAGTVPECLARITTKKAIEALAKEEIEHAGGYYDAGRPMGRPYDWARINRPDIAEQAAAAWALLVTPTDGAKAAAEELRRKLDALRFAKIPGYFPTPADLVARMIEAADLSDGSRVLEPSAGSGAIADALRDAGHKVECVERHASLCEVLRLKGHSLIRGDFLELSPCGLYDAAVMNPPFEGGQDLQHVRHAWEWIKPGGALVAIMGAGVSFRQDRRFAEFRKWADEIGGTFDDIPAGTFKESGTGVASVMFHAIKGSAADA